MGRIGRSTREAPPGLAIRLLLRGGYQRLEQITEADLLAVEGRRSSGIDTVDATLCALGGLRALAPTRLLSPFPRRQPPTPARWSPAPRCPIASMG